MILWITGNSGAGKTTIARLFSGTNIVHLDGDEMRKSMNIDLGLSMEDRRENNLRIARLARALESQGFFVVVSVIAPTEQIRKEVKAITNCVFMYVPFEGDDKVDGKPYEKPISPDIILKERDI